MRFVAALLITLALTACSIDDSVPAAAVDASNLPPLSSREQSLIYGADGAAQQGNIAAAERDYMSAVAISKGHIEAHLALARLYEQQKEPAKERAILERALVFQPNHALANYLFGKIELDANRFDAAREAFTRGLMAQPGNIDLMVGQAVADDMLGAHEKAQSTYTRILRENPKASLAGVRTNLAMSYLLSGTPQKAVDLLKAEVKKPNTSSVTRHNLALAYGLLGRNAEAKKLLEGEIDEETRLLTVARLKEYIKERAAGASPAVPNANFDRDETAPAEVAKPAAKKPATPSASAGEAAAPAKPPRAKPASAAVRTVTPDSKPQ